MTEKPTETVKTGSAHSIQIVCMAFIYMLCENLDILSFFFPHLSIIACWPLFPSPFLVNSPLETTVLFSIFGFHIYVLAHKEERWAIFLWSIFLDDPKSQSVGKHS